MRRLIGHCRLPFNEDLFLIIPITAVLINKRKLVPSNNKGTLIIYVMSIQVIHKSYAEEHMRTTDKSIAGAMR